MRIFLTGFMGSGKTTLGRRLAARMGYPFIDLDEVLELRAGMTIASYFAAKGEGAFRKLEAAVLRDTAYPEDAVIATGGGLPCYFDNMQWMKTQGTVVYLQLPPKTLADRLESGKEERPLLKDKRGAALVAYIEEKLGEREPFYTQAGIIADGISLTAEKLEQILRFRG